MVGKAAGSNRMKKDLAIGALDMAVALRRPPLRIVSITATGAANIVPMNTKRGYANTALKPQCLAKVTVTIMLQWRRSLRQSKLN